MLTRSVCRSTTLLVVLLLAALTPGLMPPAHADSDSWAKRFIRDVVAVQQITKGKGVTVAVLADGVDTRFPSLRGAVKPGRDFVKSPRPQKIIGTVVASLIAGGGPTHDAPFGIRGLAPGVTILPVRVFPNPFEGAKARDWLDGKNADEKTFAKGIRYAADQGADVIWTPPYFWGTDYTGVAAAVAYAQSKNAMVITGNVRAEGMNEATYPAAITGVIGVGAVDEKGKRFRKDSGKNSAVLVAAPGAVLPLHGPDGTLGPVWGTTPASAWVTAVAALVRSEYPKLTTAQVAQVIAQSAHHPKGGYNTDVGFGIVNPIGALRQARTITKQPLAPVAGRGVMAGTAHFGGAAPKPITAVRHDVRLLAGFSGLAGVGLLIIVLVLVLAARGRRPTPAAPAAPAAAGGQVAWMAGSPPESDGAPGSVPGTSLGPPPESG